MYEVKRKKRGRIEKLSGQKRIDEYKLSESQHFVCVRMYVCDLTDLAGALSGEVNRPKPGANILVGVWGRLIRIRSKRL